MRYDDRRFFVRFGWNGTFPSAERYKAFSRGFTGAKIGVIGINGAK